MSSTAIFIFVVLAVVFIYDGFLLHKGYQHTISWTLYSASRRWTIIPFLFGILAGHLWFGIEIQPEHPCVPTQVENGQK